MRDRIRCNLPYSLTVLESKRRLGIQVPDEANQPPPLININAMKRLLSPMQGMLLFLFPMLAVATPSAAPAEVTVRWANTHQRITGFGGSGGNDSAASFQKLTPSNQQRLCDLLFDAKRGIGLNMVRNEIYAWRIQPTQGVWDWIKDNDQVWLMRQAKARGATNFWSAVWSPPLFMKSNGILTNGGSFLKEYSQAYADFLVRYVREYKTRFDLDIQAVSISNEPEVKQSYQSTVWSGEEMRDLIRDYLGPTFRKEGLPTRIIVPENCTWDHLAKWADVILADAGARQFVDIIAAHQYDQSYTGSEPKFPPSTPETAYPAAKTHGKEFWQTEVSFIGGKPDPGIGWGLGTALLIHNAMLGGEVNAWIWWVFLNPWKDNEGLTDIAGDSFVVNKRLWTFGNFSRFVRPGWVMIEATSNPATNVYLTAFKDPSSGQFALIAINNADEATVLQTKFDGFSCSSLTPWVTDAASDLAEKPPVAGPVTGFPLVLGAKSVTTFVGVGGEVKSKSVSANSFQPGEVWLDSVGEPIRAHDGGFYYENGVYYWFGEDKRKGGSAGHTHATVCYSSRDLYSWKNEANGNVTPELGPQGSLFEKYPLAERPKVVRNDKTGKYVMWVHLENANYTLAQAGILVAEKVTGPYKFIKALRVNNDNNRDSTLYRDDDTGKAYFIYSAGDNSHLDIAELDDDYLNPVRVINTETHCEAPAILKHEGLFYLLKSAGSGFGHNDNDYAIAESMMGPWTNMKNLAVGTNSANTFQSQVTAVLRVQHGGYEKMPAFIFVADRWNETDIGDSRLLFLPIAIHGRGDISVSWHDRWDLSVFRGANSLFSEEQKN